ncbi:FAD-binding and (Fe-S)-binding domain-containing protein [Phycicoccus ginsengisoli]
MATATTRARTDSTHEALERDLRREVDAEVRFDAGSRAAYSTDASNFRQVPIGVVVPRSVEAGAAAVAVCRRHDAPLLSRGGGTSLAGQCTNTAVVIDWSKYCTGLLEVDPEARTCVVEPGIVLDSLNAALAEHHMRFGPEPATHPNCTLGGMIGNNSCGATAQRTGKVVDNVVALEVLLYDGTRFWCGETSEEEYAEIERHGDLRASVYRRARAIAADHADLIRERFPDIPRRVSGYNLDSLLPENHLDLAKALVGSESTLVTVLRAKLRLVPVVEHRTLVVLGFRDIVAAARAVPAIVEHEPIALEGLDHKLLVDNEIKHLNATAMRELPEGTGYLMVQFGGATTQEADDRARAMLDALGDTEHDPQVKFLDDPDAEHELWLVRESGLAATAHVPHHPDTFEGWEDSAVAPERLGDYLHDLKELFEEFGYEGETAPSLYGHFGQGCLHTRIPFGLYTDEGVAHYRRFMERAARLVSDYGGSLSGEHGDGQSRGELLPVMFGSDVVRLFEQLKDVFDPRNRMNPGKVVRARRLDQDLRLGGEWVPRPMGRPEFAYPSDGGSFVDAANRCVGVGRCRQHGHEAGSVMCPSYQATGEEEHSTRGRARLLFEMLDGHRDGTIRDGWRSTAVRDALDLCLSCKGCKSDCPANVDMATYKAEFLSHHYRHRLRPRSHYTLGWLPLAAYGVHRAGLARVGNAVGGSRVAPLLERLAGLDPRQVPRFAEQTFQADWAGRTRGAGNDGSASRGRVVLWPDTFTNHFHPWIARAAVEVIESAGWEVVVPTEPLCCGLTWISTGQLGPARRALRRTASALWPHLRDGALVVGLEPSCTSVFRSDGPELMPDDREVARLRDATVTLAELLEEHTPGWRAPQWRPGTDAAQDPQDGTRDAPAGSGDRPVDGAAQVHCHQHAVLGWDADAQVLSDMGLEVPALDSGCCGLAGNFGFERGHFETSRKVAENGLLPALDRLPRDAVVLADGFSCRTQVAELAGGRRAHHLAEVLAQAQHREAQAQHRGAQAGPVSPRPGPGSPGHTPRHAATAAARTGGSRMPGPHDAVTSLVSEQHGRVRTLVRSVQETRGEERAEAYRSFQDYLAAHEAMEELVVHPALMAVADGTSVAKDRVDEERQATSLVQQLEQFEVDTPQFEETFAELAQAVSQHAEAEEHQELTMLLPRVDEEAAGRMVAGLHAVGEVAEALRGGGFAGSRGFAATLGAAKDEVTRRGLTADGSGRP